ncbi:aminotransferase class V-fold PLP-dependent enzyme [Sulfitobacter sp. S190]|uniref:pyridoxal phosphate-dependent decarboxylase family protein n=1 Tax=Sulfitobacter sp. S190 TaxID=2867022 RepID=UPI0021A386D1|nr:aminotransferase class V-fold PLP-dependent enzyme [Sulfitobacter sp. S190]UWR22000.1 aminotransferase class V-fold PLP-dependent enzyme [Sulfitobacter sp. S190]
MKAFPFPASNVTRILEWTRRRILGGPDPKHGAQSHAALEPVLGGSITPQGIGGAAAFALFTDTIVPSTRPFGHPTSLSFVASAPTDASLSFDAALGAAGIFAGNWDGGAGAIHAENQTLEWLAGLAGWGDSAGGVYVAGGTLGNLSALHAARDWKARRMARPDRWAILCSTEAHSSIRAVARVMDVDVIEVPPDETGRMSGADASAACAPHVFAIVGNAGATNSGAVDDIAGLAELAHARDLWLHLDGAYGLAALSDPNTRPVFDGIERAHSFTVDPHKWLFAPYDSCALVYRNAADAANAHGQSAEYLDAVDKTHWNPSDYALHLTRRARGLPFWYSLATHGTRAYGDAIAKTIAIARDLADGIDKMAGLELVLGPQLSVVLFRPTGMSDAQMDQWAEAQRRSGALLCLPTTWRGQKVFRLCIVNPQTSVAGVLETLGTLTTEAG